jgi:hypothetical protein
MGKLHKLINAVTGQPSWNILKMSVVCYDFTSDGRPDTLGQKKTVDYQGRKVSGEVLNFQATAPEAWNQYTLEDGSSMKMKLVLLEVVRLLDEYNPATGDPVYMFSAQQIVGNTSPDNLRKKKN